MDAAPYAAPGRMDLVVHGIRQIATHPTDLAPHEAANVIAVLVRGRCPSVHLCRHWNLPGFRSRVALPDDAVVARRR
jgi:hypothetical protein